MPHKEVHPKKYPIIALVGAVLACEFACAGATIQVPRDQPTIRAAITAASSTGGDEIVISPGVYKEFEILIPKSLTLTSSGGPAVTVVDAERKGRVFVVQGNNINVTLSGITVQNGQTPRHENGGGVQVKSGKCKISNCVVQGVWGPGDYSSAPLANDGPNREDVVVESTTVRNNYAANGCGIRNAAVKNSLIYNNSAGNNPVALLECNATNCVVYGNTGGALSIRGLLEEWRGVRL